MRRLGILLLAFALGAMLAAQDTVVLLVRHGEKVSEEPDAALSQAGLARAGNLAKLFATLRPAALFASHRQRTRQTLEPLAKTLDLTVQVRPAGEEAALAKHILEAWKGRTVVVCGHSNTLGTLTAALGVKEPFAEPKGYDRWWIVRIPATGAAKLEERSQP